MPLNAEKSRLRAELKRARAASRAAHPGAGEALALKLSGVLGELCLSGPGFLAGYWPTGSEIDPRPAMQASGLSLLLPVVIKRDEALAFRRWSPGDPLARGLAGTQEPCVQAESETPDIVLVPGLGFDVEGFRLGYGGGYYDRTLVALRSRRKVLAIGLCFDEQVIAQIPRGPFDQRVDWILTPERQIPVSGGWF